VGASRLRVKHFYISKTSKKKKTKTTIKAERYNVGSKGIRCKYR